MCVCVCTGGGLPLSTAALFITLIRWGQGVRCARVLQRIGAQLVSVKWDVIYGGVAFIKPCVLAADSERWQAGKWSFRWPLRCLNQIDSSELTAEPLSSLQRLSVEHGVNYKTRIFAPVGYTLQQLQAKLVHINGHFHQQGACFQIWSIKFDEIKAHL